MGPKRHVQGSGTTSKRQRKCISLKDKREAIERLNRGESVKSVAELYGVGNTTVRDWKKAADTIRRQAATVKRASVSTKISKPASNKLEGAVLDYCNQARRQGVILTAKLVCERAMAIYEEIVRLEPSEAQRPLMKDFCASAGWFRRFCNRHGIHFGTVQGEAGSADTVSAEKFKAEIVDLIDDYSPHAIFNADETGLFWKMLPSKTHMMQEEKQAPGYKQSKDRITVLLCANAAGDFPLPPACIYRVQKPSAFKNLNRPPVWWRANKKAWITQQVFEDWFTSEFIPKVFLYLSEKGLPRKVLLFLDNAPGHVQFLQNYHPDVKVVFLPPNTTTLLQPLDQGAIAMFKRHYIAVFMRTLLTKSHAAATTTEGKHVDGPYDPQPSTSSGNTSFSFADEIKYFRESWKTLNILDAVHMIKFAWSNVKESALRGVWKKMCPSLINVFEVLPDPMVECDVSDELLINMVNQVPGNEEILGADDVQEQLEEHNYELTTEELAMLHTDDDHFSELDEEQDKGYMRKEDAKRIMDHLQEAMRVMIQNDTDQDRAARCYNQIQNVFKNYYEVFYGDTQQPKFTDFFKKSGTNTPSSAESVRSTRTEAASSSSSEEDYDVETTKDS